MDCTVYSKDSHTALARGPPTWASEAVLVWLPIDTLTWGLPVTAHAKVEVDLHRDLVAALVGAARGRTPQADGAHRRGGGLGGGLVDAEPGNRQQNEHAGDVPRAELATW